MPPIRFEVGVAEIPDSTVTELRKILEDMRDRRNVRLHLVGHADNQPLSPALAAVFGDNEGLSRERAGEVAELLQRTLLLPPEGISYEWAGDQKPVASNATEAGRAQNRRVEVEVWYDEVEQGTALDEVLVEQEFRRIKVCRIETVCRLRYVDGNERRTRVQNVVAPLRFDAEAVEVTPAYIEQIRQAVGNLSDRHNVLVKFVGYTDDAPLGERNERIYGDHVGLSRAQSRRVALAVQEALNLPTSSIDSDGRGTMRPLGSNATAQGRALNRRVEVEFWYDDPLQELPDEPQLCPAPGNELVTRVYDPPWGALPELAIENGAPVVPAGFAGLLRRGLADVDGRMNARLRFVGYTRNERLERRTTLVYGDDIGLSAARARRAMEQIAADMQLAPEQVEFEGRGYVHSDDVVNAGFVQGETSHVVVQVVYDEVAELDDYDGVDITPLTRELEPKNAFGLNLMRITVDGEPHRRSGPQLRRHPALHRRRAAAGGHPVRLRQPRGRPAPRRGGRAGDRRRLSQRRLVGPRSRCVSRCTRTTRTSSSGPRCGSSSSSSRSRPSRSVSSCSGPTAPASGCPSPACSRRRRASSSTCCAPTAPAARSTRPCRSRCGSLIARRTPTARSTSPPPRFSTWPS